MENIIYNVLIHVFLITEIVLFLVIIVWYCTIVSVRTSVWDVVLLGCENMLFVEFLFSQIMM